MTCNGNYFSFGGQQGCPPYVSLKKILPSHLYDK